MTAHPCIETLRFSLCVVLVGQSPLKVKVELRMDVAWLVTVTAANIRPQLRQ